MHNSSGAKWCNLMALNSQILANLMIILSSEGLNVEARYLVNMTLYPMGVLWKAEANTQTLGKYVKCVQ